MHTLDQLLGQLLEDTVGTDQVFRFLVVGQDLIQQLVGDGVLSPVRREIVAHEPVTQKIGHPRPGKQADYVITKPGCCSAIRRKVPPPARRSTP